MRAHKIKALRGYKAPRVIHGRPSIITPNKLERAFTVDRHDPAWVTDITYIRTWQGWLYLVDEVDTGQRNRPGRADDSCYGGVSPEAFEAASL